MRPVLDAWVQMIVRLNQRPFGVRQIACVHLEIGGLISADEPHRSRLSRKLIRSEIVRRGRRNLEETFAPRR